MNNYIYEYYQKIKSGEIVVGKWILKLYEYIIQGLENGLFFYDAKRAARGIKFIENFCHHCEGRDDLIKLELWQKAMFSIIYGIVDADGLRQFREVFFICGRKQGKSIIAAAAIAKHVFADIEEYGKKVFCVAPKLDQADIVYNAFWQTIRKEPELQRLIKSRKSDYFVESTNSTVKKIAFSAKKSDGFNPSLTICDEIGAWVGDGGLKQYEVMKSAIGARKEPILMSITTANYPRGGIYDELMKRSTRFLMGDSKERRLLPILYMIDDEDKWNDINELRKSLPNLGVSVSVDYMLEEIAIAEQSLSKLAEFKTKYCNIPQISSQAWLTAKAIKNATGPELKFEDFRSSYCVAGIDLSRTTDLTAAVIVIEKNGIENVIAHFWMPEEKIDEATARDGLPYREYIKKGWLSPSGQNFVDYIDVYYWMTALVEQYEILPLKVGYDRYSAQYLLKDPAHGLETYGFHCDDVFQGYNLTPCIDQLEGSLRDGKINIGNNELLQIHLIDTALQRDNDTRRKKIVKLSPTAHIDGTAALLDAITVKMKWYEQVGDQLRNN